MLKCVKSGHKGRDLGKAIQIFDNWNYKFDVESSAASLFASWEMQMSIYLHETTVSSIDMRKSF